jgi:energy-coupling factor transporter transmembrane protein EcfT
MIKFIIFLSLIPSFSYAYIDPITGSIVIQAIIGGFVTVGFFIKMYWRKLVKFFKRKLGKEEKVEKSEESES